MSHPLVMLHGWASAPAIFDPLRVALNCPDAHCPALTPATGSLADWADRIAPDLPDRASVLGWSLGGMLALALAARHPHKVARLVLIASTPRFVSGPDWPHGLDAATVQAFRDGYLAQPARTLKRFIALQALGDEARHAVSATLETLTPTGDHTALAHGLRLLAESDLRTVMPAPNLPALLIHGQQDSVVPPTASQWMAERWHAARMLRLEGCAHAPFLSWPEAVTQRIAEMCHA